MPAAHILAANRQNANTAGHTTAIEDTPGISEVPGVNQAPGAPSPTTITEFFHATDFGNIFSGGTHPEAVPSHDITALTAATDSVKGRLGGLVPSRGSVVQSGPAGGSAGAKRIVSQMFSDLKTKLGG